MNKKRKHHIVPATYLTGFTNQEGKLYEYRADDCSTPQYREPRGVGYRRDYYAQELGEGTLDYNSIEDFFEKNFESKWRSLIEKITSKKSLTCPDYDLLLQFACMLRIRVPAARESVEHLLAEIVKAAGEMVDKTEKLPPRPKDLKDLSIRDLSVSINPQKSIESMELMASIISPIFHGANFAILFNKTTTPFLTSDNPVIYFKPTIKEKELIPYSSGSPNHLAEIIFPLTSNILLHGHPTYGANELIKYKDLNNSKSIFRFNRLIARFAYEKFYTPSNCHVPLIKKHRQLSPVPCFKNLNEVSLNSLNISYVFGEREKLPKWKRKK